VCRVETSNAAVFLVYAADVIFNADAAGGAPVRLVERGSGE
jgi:hypothetical protein